MASCYVTGSTGMYWSNNILSINVKIVLYILFRHELMNWAFDRMSGNYDGGLRRKDKSWSAKVGYSLHHGFKAMKILL